MDPWLKCDYLLIWLVNFEGVCGWGNEFGLFVELNGYLFRGYYMSRILGKITINITQIESRWWASLLDKPFLLEMRLE
ncbi:MAG: hypothetical protein Ct9H90mP27_4530 [Gammaproteobacteria bacterium]|nr:MAG: hypothetical protein Ct9H90mP27_4530 [Gammaproteobacteria bacterium]